MKLILQIKLLPTPEQFNILKETLVEANAACNVISERCFEKRIFNRFKMHFEIYSSIKSSFKICSRITTRCIAKVVDAYKLDRKSLKLFKPYGSIAYDNKNLRYKKDNSVSISTINGRLHIPFIAYNPEYFSQIKGQAKLVLKKGKFYLYQVVDIQEQDQVNVNSFIGCDFGQTDVCTLSDGTNYNSEQLKKVRKKYSKVRTSVQSKGTKGAKRLLKRLSGRERRFVSINNHTISKQIVLKAKSEGKGVAIEDLSNIRKTAKPKSKQQKTELNRWSFYQLRQYLTYKSLLNGVPMVVINPAYTSQTCSDCKHIGNRTGKRFKCNNCGNVSDADVNAAKNIATWGCVVNQPEERSVLYCEIPNAIFQAQKHFTPPNNIETGILQ